MKGIIYYYSATGNTKLACRYLAAHIGFPVDLVDVTDGRASGLGACDVVGFASPTDFAGVPQAFVTFIEGLPLQKGTRAFVLNTFGALSGKTLQLLEAAATSRGFEVLAGHSLRMPVSYPPMIARHIRAKSAPSPKRLAEFDTFVRNLGVLLDKVAKRESIGRRPVSIGFLNGLFQAKPRTYARKDMGDKFVDESLCTECGLCRDNCPYHAIRMDPKPQFDMGKCFGCWRCYNGCPIHAIYTRRYRGGPYYTGPSDVLKQKLGAQ